MGIFLCVVPALFTRISSFPKLLSASATICATCAVWVTSICAGAASPPAALISFATLSASSPRTSATKTFAPNSAKCLAMPSPNPPPDPVTIAVRPLSFMVPFVSALDAAHTEVFHFDEFFDAGLLDTSERSYFGGDEPLVDAHDAIFQSLSYAPDAPDVACIEVGRQAE